MSKEFSFRDLKSQAPIPALDLKVDDVEYDYKHYPVFEEKKDDGPTLINTISDFG